MPRLVGLAALALVAIACIPTARLSQDGVFGSYVVNGVDPSGTEYTGRLSISPGPDSNDVIVEWIITGAIIHGEGTIDENVISVDWETVTAPQGTSTGTATYEVLEDGHLFGTLRVDGFDQVGTETVYPDP